MTYLWTLKYIIPFIIGLFVAYFFVGLYYKPIINTLKVENVKLTEANQAMVNTINKLELDKIEDKKLYNKQINSCKKVLDGLQKIDSLKPGDSNENNANDSIIGNLNIMWEDN